MGQVGTGVDEAAALLSGKVFGLGLARTGTTSLHRAMGVLGLRSAPDSRALLDRIDLDFLSRYDAFFDNPIPFRYRSLDEVCPDARYIVTRRPLDEWLTSMEWLFGPGLDRLDPPTRTIGDRVHRELYGSDRFDRALLREVYDSHYATVGEWVEGRPHVWLELDEGLNWGPICDLLDRPVPAEEFPFANRAGPRSSRRSLARFVRRRR